MSVAVAAAVAPVSVAAALRGFDSWAASRVLAPAEFIPGGDKLSQTALGPELDRYEPTPAERFEAAGFDLGRDGILTTADAALPDATPRELLLFALDFGAGQHAGFARFAREAGFAAGLDGRGDALPGTIPGRFALAFELGHGEGIAERRARGESLEEWYAELAADAEEAEYQRELEALARNAGGWDRLIGREME